MAATLLDHRGRTLLPAGLILLPNIDVDGRKLPAKVEPATDRRLRLDHDLQAKSRLDDDPLELQVRLDASTDPATAVVALRIEGPLREQITVLDARKAPIRARMSGDTTFALTLRGSRSATVFLETAALRGTPLARNTGDPTQIALIVGGVEQQRVPLTIAPLLLDGNLGEPERLYICRVDEETGSNAPSLRDVEEALRRTGVPVIEIPQDINLGDSWIQDQVQMGSCHAPGQSERVVLHLPRSRSNVVQTGPLVNLKEFARQHFPSRNLGLFDHFWSRRLGTIEDEAGTSEPLLFESSYEISLRLASVIEAWSTMSTAFSIYSTAAGMSDRSLWFIFGRFRRDEMHYGLLQRRLPNVLRMLERFFDRLSAHMRAKKLDSLAAQLAVDRPLVRERVRAAKENVQLVMTPRGPRFRIKRKDQPPVFVDPDAAGELVDRLAVMHDSTNYGGNVEVSPPVTDAPLGKVVIGSAAARPMDPDLEGFFFSQQAQPVVPVDTSWLAVGHVDEMMTFVPATSEPSFAIPFSSPGEAIRLLTEAQKVKSEARQRNENDLPHYFLTDLLRGKRWLYHYPQDGFDATRPPFIHRLARLGTYSEPGRGHSREYEAGISVESLFEDVGLKTNAAIQKAFIDPLVETTLSLDFDDAELVGLPVIFDEVPEGDTGIDPARIETSAYTPNLANLQVVGNVLLVPRPYGPRMGVKGAIETLRRCLDSRFHGKLTEDYFKKSGLLEVIHWDLGEAAPASSADPFAGGGADDPLGTQGLDFRPPLTDLKRIALQFNDGFLEGPMLLGIEVVQQKIRAANSDHFDRDGRLRPGWRKLKIPERSVDLFEAVTRIRLEALGNAVRFVDSWYYHVRHGEIHCGTNVLRKAKPAVNWWELKPDVPGVSAASAAVAVA